MNKQQQEIIQKISALEVTNELCNYLEDRYQKVFENDLFLLSDKTKNVLLADEEMQKPITPFGDSLTIVYDATQGQTQLVGATKVYFHSGAQLVPFGIDQLEL